MYFKRTVKCKTTLGGYLRQTAFFYVKILLKYAHILLVTWSVCLSVMLCFSAFVKDIQLKFHVEIYFIFRVSYYKTHHVLLTVCYAEIEIDNILKKKNIYFFLCKFLRKPLRLFDSLFHFILID